MNNHTLPSPTVSDLNSVTKKLEFVCPAEIVTSKYEKLLEQQTKQAKIKGFRPGTAPRAMVEKMYKEQVLGEVQRSILMESFRGAMEQLDFTMVGEPEVSVPKQVALDEKFEFSVTVGLYPEPEINFEGGYKLNVEKGEVKEGDIDAVLDRLRESKAESKPLAFRNTAAKDDVVNGMMKVTVEGESTRKPEPVTVPLNDEYLPKELVEKVIGLETGSVAEAVATLPESHQDPKLRGKKVTYNFELQGLAEKILPELNDSFAESLGLQTNTILELRLKIKENLEKEVERESKMNAHVAVLEKLIEENPFEVPQSLIDEEIKRMLYQMGALDAKKVKPEDVSAVPFRDHLGEQAEKRVKSAVALDRIAEKQATPLSESEKRSAYQGIADQYGMDVDQVIELMEKSGEGEAFEREQVRSKLLDDLVAKCEVTFVEPKKDVKENS